MSEETFPYDQWVNEALRSVLSRALKQLAENGPIGDHHFFINFNTTDDDVEIPGFLRAQYPEEITIVLQHQFENLIIDDQGFEVTLSFSGKKSRLCVPFDAVTSFADPSVNFGLQIGVNAVNEAMMQVQGEAELEDDVTDRIQEDLTDDMAGNHANSPAPFAPAAALAADDFEDAEDGSSESDNEEDDDTPKTAEVIALDAFRKK
ncbi:MAG: hypothetical protein HOF23_11320 [Rhodospirillaceae bacterium]|jgi:uncharacterized protein|nr:hypothetical protein [Rhodospirillaceae bacterium]